MAGRSDGAEAPPGDRRAPYRLTMTRTHALFYNGSTNPVDDFTNDRLRRQEDAEAAARELSAHGTGGTVLVRARELRDEPEDLSIPERWTIDVAFYANGYKLDAREEPNAEPPRVVYLADETVIATAELVGGEWYLFKAAGSIVAQSDVVTSTADSPDREHALRSLWFYVEDWVPDPA